MIQGQVALLVVCLTLLNYYTIILLRVSSLGLVHVTGAATVELVSNHREVRQDQGGICLLVYSERSLCDLVLGYLE